MDSFIPLTLLILAAVLVEKLVEQIKEKSGGRVQGLVTSLIALALAIILVLAVPALRFLTLAFPGEVNQIADAAFTALVIAAGSGFLASLEGSLLARKEIAANIASTPVASSVVVDEA